MVDSEEGHLTRFIEQVGEGDEGVGLLQVEDEDGSDEGHSLNLRTPQTLSQLIINTIQVSMLISVLKISVLISI